MSSSSSESDSCSLDSGSSSDSDSYGSDRLSDQRPAKKPKRLNKLDLEADKDIHQIRDKTAAGLRLVHQVFLNKFANKNAVLSPLSIHVALSMVAAGAAGPFKEQIVSFLGASSEEQLHSFASKVTGVVFSDSSGCGGPSLSAANAVWLRDTRKFKPSYEKVVETDYKAVTRLLDFTKVDESVHEVNAWAEKETNGLIKGIVNSNSFNTETVLVLANALYFKGVWDKNFNPKLTKHDAFHLIDGSTTVRVPFMCKEKVDAYIGIYDTFKVLNLSYRIGEDDVAYRSFSMSIFLPDDIDGLPSLLQRCSTENDSESGFLDRHIPKTKVEVGKLRIPKFKIEVDVEVMNVVERMGLKVGMLTEMVEEMEQQPAVTVSSIVQKAFVEVNEEGTKAAAVSRLFLATTCALRPAKPVRVDFIADHPFMFVIQENSSKLVLFAGQVLDPTK